MIHSFRLRLALLSALLAGVALAAFALGAWWLVRDVKLGHLDATMRAHAEREVNRQRDAAGWQRTVANILAGLDSRDSQALILLVQDTDGTIRYRSEHWPAALEAERLPWPRSGKRQQDGAAAWWPIRVALAEDGGERPPPPPGENRRPPGTPPLSGWHVENLAGRQWHIGLATSERGRVAVGIDAAVIDEEMVAVRNAFLLALPAALLLIGLGSWAFSARALRPMRKLAASAAAVTAEGLDQRIPSTGEDREFVELVEVYNGMLARLERGFRQARRFSADAAHELKTPLAILQGQLERAIQSAGEGSAMQIQLSGILDEVRRLSTISRKLLLLSQADAGRLTVHRETYDLAAALRDLLEDARMLAPHLQVDGSIQANLTVAVDAGLFPQVLHNLIANAIKYNVADGWISIDAKRTAKEVEIHIANASHGIPADAGERLFERFYRGDAAHGRAVEGVGLGLAVAREIVRAHGGDIVLHPRPDGNPSFKVTLPV